ncbi:sigma factor-like helix-turn-helix DNA-binding protein [Candidatus Marithrix sp. Canyon 246]|uniref:sigma factor-like helix-turn-helix DNA-binding protein n=1 Tax=Candidatus Marithrix sp. Canyon 246 TaxID=1827136 RepID=UPI00084A1895|nr:sigma factor-like helix-turn-helix DNA-binding protein [Candidatus Marithrix sp. Canyon 246]
MYLIRWIYQFFLLKVNQSSSSSNNDQLKQTVFDHWKHIERLADKRFPDDTNLKLEASNYVLDVLEADNWKRIAAFKGKNIKAFITKISLNLFSDFWNKKFGKQRPNKWLRDQIDSIYQTSYQLLVKSKYSKREVVEILLTLEPKRERWKIEEVVNAVIAHCPAKLEYHEVSLDDNVVVQDKTEDLDEQNILQALSQLIDGNINEVDQPLNKLIGVLDQNVRLNEEECMLLRLRYHSGLTMKQIAAIVNLTASQVDKRIKKTLTRLNQAFKEAGV